MNYMPSQPTRAFGSDSTMSPGEVNRQNREPVVMVCDLLIWRAYAMWRWRAHLVGWVTFYPRDSCP